MFFQQYSQPQCTHNFKKEKTKAFFAVFSISDNLKHAVVGLSTSQKNLWKMEFSLSIKRARDRE